MLVYFLSIPSYICMYTHNNGKYKHINIKLSMMLRPFAYLVKYTFCHHHTNITYYYLYSH